MAILVTSAVLVTYLVVRPKPAEEGKEDGRERRKKGSGGVRRPLGSRTFVSDNSEGEGQEEASTGTRGVESSGREAMQRKKGDSKYL